MSKINYVSSETLKLIPLEDRIPIVKQINIPYYKGRDVELQLNNKIIYIPADMDVFNFYRKIFRKIAKQASAALKIQYIHEITDLDGFLTDFTALYFSYKKPIVEAAINILIQADIYDVSLTTFDEMHTADYCLCGEDYKFVIDAFNATIKENQIKTAKEFGMLPNLFFSGIGGLIAGTVLNVAICGIEESAIKNAKVYPLQRKKIYEQIDVENLMHRAYLDYWRVVLTLCSILKQRGRTMWYPDKEHNAIANGIFENLKENRISEEKKLEALIEVLQTNPFSEDYFDYIERQYGKTEETIKIMSYFGYLE